MASYWGLPKWPGDSWWPPGMAQWRGTRPHCVLLGGSHAPGEHLLRGGRELRAPKGPLKRYCVVPVDTRETLQGQGRLKIVWNFVFVLRL